jgi:hypothetical protein
VVESLRCSLYTYTILERRTPFGILGIPSHFSPGHRYDNSIYGDWLCPSSDDHSGMSLQPTPMMQNPASRIQLKSASVQLFTTTNSHMYCFYMQCMLLNVMVQRHLACWYLIESSTPHTIDLIAVDILLSSRFPT